MNASTVHTIPPRSFESLRAADLMMPNPISIRRGATLHEALELLTDRGFGAAPVIDERGHPIGVISRTDILMHQRDCACHNCSPKCTGSNHDCTDWDLLPEASSSEELPADALGGTTVSEIMTPAIFTVALDTPVAEIARRMVELRIHHLFVSDEDFAIVGVISPLDVLRFLRN